MQGKRVLRERVVWWKGARIHADHVVARSHVVNFKVSVILGNNRTVTSAIIQRQVDAGKASCIRRTLPFKTQIVEYAACNAGEINDTKIHYANSLPDQIN